MSAIPYEIKVEGHFESTWLHWFEGLTIVHEGQNETVLRGSLIDQAALRGVLSKLFDLNLKLVSVSRLGAPQTILA